jgi:hypothetical protein
MFGALRDCVPRMTVVKHKSSPRELMDAYDREIYGYLKEVRFLSKTIYTKLYRGI